MILLKFLNWPNNFFMSESALRRRFKSEVGINITEYVNKRKITIAKVFLGTEMPISEISKKIRIFSTHRIFTEYSKVLKASHQNNFKHVPKISFMIKQNIKNNLKLSCYPTQLPIPYSRQDTEQKTSFSRIIFLNLLCFLFWKEC